jgi:hypothetical protein
VAVEEDQVVLAIMLRMVVLAVAAVGIKDEVMVIHHL